MKQIRNPLEPPGIASQFVGRDAELDRIFALLTGPSRLITLTGPVGIGKTQLAAEVARRYQRARRVPTCSVRLASLPRDCDRDTIEDAIAHAVAGMDCSERSSWTVIVDMLAQADASSRLSPTLLVLDNCEHVLDATTAVIVAIGRRCITSIPRYGGAALPDCRRIRQQTRKALIAHIGPPGTPRQPELATHQRFCPACALVRRTASVLRRWYLRRIRPTDRNRMQRSESTFLRCEDWVDLVLITNRGTF